MKEGRVRGSKGIQAAGTAEVGTQERRQREMGRGRGEGRMRDEGSEGSGVAGTARQALARQGVRRR